MSPTLGMVLIALVFGAQIAVLSFYTPRARRRNYTLLFTRYPPQEYPRLYPVAKERLERNLAIFKPVHFAIGIGSIVVLVVGPLFTNDPEMLARWMFYCLLAQILPLYVNLPWAIRIARAFRAMPPPSVRSVELRPWRVVDFVSPLWIALGFAATVAALVSAAVAYLRAPQVLPLVVVSALVAGAVLARMAYVVLGKVTLVRADPYMSEPDTLRQRQRRLTLLFRAGALVCGYAAFMLLYAAELLRFEFAYLLAAVSIVFQLLGVGLVTAQGRDLRARDFSVYRSEERVPAPPP